MSDCIFCRIVRKEIPAEIIHEDASVVAFKDIQPQAPIHILLVPKKHIGRVMDLKPDDMALVADIHKIVQALARKFTLHESGFRLVANNGSNAGQAVDHLHYHLLGGRKMGWPPG
ncbi:MAG TPA: histidine triad nucleotide-binding protein [Elusimicrobiota bacterium]|nr:histidine triad nucleotide-binding protein [Elusimicrobiota bacterium]